MDMEFLVIVFIFLNVFLGFSILYYKLTKENEKAHKSQK